MSSNGTFDVNYLPLTQADFLAYLSQFSLFNFTTATPAEQQWLNLNANFCLLSIPACDVKLATPEYLLKVYSNAIFLSIFAIYLVVCLGLGLRYRMWGHTVGTFFGFLLEVLGYAGRIRPQRSVYREPRQCSGNNSND